MSSGAAHTSVDVDGRAGPSHSIRDMPSSVGPKRAVVDRCQINQLGGNGVVVVGENAAEWTSVAPSGLKRAPTGFRS